MGLYCTFSLLFFILRFHSFTDKIASHVAVLSNLKQVTMNTRKKLRLAWDFTQQTSISIFDKRYTSNTYNIQEDNSTSITGVLALRNPSIENRRGKPERRCRSKRCNRTHAKLEWHEVLFRCFVKTNLSTFPWTATESAVIIFGTMHSKNTRKITESNRHSRIKNMQPHIWITFQD